MGLSAFSIGLFFVSLYLVVNEWLSYLALAGIIAATIWANKTKVNCGSCTN